MQWVVANTATVGVKDWVCKKMIQINKGGGHHQPAGLPPMSLPNHARDQKRHEEVTGIVKDVAEDVHDRF